MRYFLFLALFFSFDLCTYAQVKRNSYSLNVGVHQMNSNGMLGYYDFVLGGAPTSQNPAVFMDANFLITRHVNKEFRIQGRSYDLTRLSFIYGLGYNQKGFAQKGIVFDRKTTLAYNQVIKRDYLSIYAGASYDLIYKERMRFSIGALFNPDLDINRMIYNNSNFTYMGLALRSFMALTFYVNDEIGLRLSPYFQYGLSNYYRRLKYTGLTDYKPYGFGLNIGLVF